MKKKKGAVLIVVLILLMALFVMGMTILGMKSTQAKNSRMMMHSVISKYVAESGMEDARIKLQKDLDFPPIDGRQTTSFTYNEPLSFPGDNNSVGSYTVTVDVSRCNPDDPNYDQTIIINSKGEIKDGFGKVVSTHLITGILDASITDRNGNGSLNPFLYQYIDWQDHGNI